MQPDGELCRRRRREHEPRCPEPEPAHVVEVDDDVRQDDAVAERVHHASELQQPDRPWEAWVEAPQPPHGPTATGVRRTGSGNTRSKPSAPRPTLDNVKRGPLGEGDFFNDSRFREIAQDFLRAQLNNAKVDQLERILSTQLDFLVDNEYSAESYKVFNIGAINLLRVIGIELAFPIEQTIPVTNEVFAKAKQEAQRRRHHSAPFSLRFVKAASPYLAMQNGRDTMMLEMGLLVAAHESRELLTDYEQFFIDKRAARPHWGLDMSVLTSFAQVQGLYGKAADDWLRVYQRLNSAGTFDGRFTDRLGISMRPKG